MATVPKLPRDWYCRRFQAVGRAQSRYLLLVLVILAYTIGLSLGSPTNINVGFLGLADVPKSAITAVAMVVLDVLLLGLFGSFQAAREAFDELAERLREEGTGGADTRHVDEHPNVADFLSYATFVNAKPSRWTRYGALVLYTVPALAGVLWAVVVWWQGFTACRLDPSWLVWVYRVSTPLVLWVLAATVIFLRRRWDLFASGRVRP